MPITNSSISSSEPDRDERESAAQWRRFALLLVAGAAAVAVLLVGLIVVIDPYDTGRPGIVTKPGMLARPGSREQGPRWLAASRGRDQTFDAAIIGNSNIQLLSPDRLGPSSGARFVSLAVPGTQPGEHLKLLDWFTRHHATPFAIVLGADATWCTGNPALPAEHPFPDWMFERSILAYVAGLVRFATLEDIAPRLIYLLSATAERARPDGYWDYESDYIAIGYDVRPDRRAVLAEQREILSGTATDRFPAIERLAMQLARIPDATKVILLHPPVFATALPDRNGVTGSVDAACKAVFAALAQARPRTAIVDWRVDVAEAHEPSLWFDHTHYRQPIAQRVEASIAATITSLD